ncbi:MAG: HAMP domain-containing histidine kinase, partial [Ruminococcus sp.]|nr:HAMP domain-containing histidine kinase [Ruminococcus sp.]
MIKRLRKRFILICTLSFLAVFVIMVTAIYVTNTIRQNRRIDIIADFLSENGGSFPEQKDTPFSFSNKQPDFINKDTPFTTRFYTVTLDKNGAYQSCNTEFVSDISETDAEQSAEEVLKKKKSRGWYGDFRYKVYEYNGNKHIIFISGKNHRFSSNEFMKLTVRIFGLGSLAVLALIIILSKFAMRPAAESYQKQKQFVTDANHELKTPLTLILTNIDIAEAELGQNEWLDDIRSEGERMSKLVNRLVTLSRMDEEKAFVNFKEFDLSSAVSDAVSEFTELASMYGKNLTANIDKDIKFHGDESEIRQLTAILLDNAVKYCDEGGSIKAVLSQKKHPTLTVTNNCKSV